MHTSPNGWTVMDDELHRLERAHAGQALSEQERGRLDTIVVQ